MYKYKQNSTIDAYGDTENVIHLKFGEARKGYNFTDEFTKQHPKFVREYTHYFNGEKSLFRDPLSILNYIETFNLPVKLYSNYVDQEFENVAAAKEWVVNEYQGTGSERQKLYRYQDGGYVGLDNEKA